MICDINISEKQFEYLKLGVSQFFVTANASPDIFQSAEQADASTNCFSEPISSFARVNSIDKAKPRMIAEVQYVALFLCADSLVNSCFFSLSSCPNPVARKIITNEIYDLFNDNAEVLALNLISRYCDDSPIEEIGMFAITRLLYHSLLFLRNLPLKKTLFGYKLEKKAQKQFFEHINNVGELLHVLKGKSDFNSYLIRSVPMYSEEIYAYPNISSLLDLSKTYLTGVNCYNLNDLRMKLMAEIEYGIKEMSNAYENKDYSKIQDIGYELHNHPEMIMRMYDWRKK